MEPIVQDEIATAFRAAMRLDESFPIEDRMGFDDIPGWDSVGHMNLISQLEIALGHHPGNGRDCRSRFRWRGAESGCAQDEWFRMIRPEATLVETLLDHAARHPRQAAVVAVGETVSYGDFARMIRAAAGADSPCPDRSAAIGSCSAARTLRSWPPRTSPCMRPAAWPCCWTPIPPRKRARWIVDDAEARLTLAARRT